MKKFLSRILTALLILPAAAAPAGTRAVRTTTLTAYYDLDGAASSATVIAAAQTIVDGATYTIAAQPDTPRPLTVTLVDANASISVCVLTIVGTRADGTAFSATTDLTGGSGLKVLSPLYNTRTVTSISTGTCTGEGGAADTVQVGTSSTIPGVFPLAFGFADLGVNDIGSATSIRSPYEWRKAPLTVSTSGFSTTISGTASAGAFSQVDVGDLLLFNVKGRLEERVVITNADNDTVTVEAGITLSPAQGFSYRKLNVGVDQEDNWISVDGFDAVHWTFNVVQMNGTGGITTTVNCRNKGAGSTTGHLVYTNSVAAAGRSDFSLDNRLAAFQQCRAGLAWGTNDDAVDTTTAQEQINITVSGVMY